MQNKLNRCRREEVNNTIIKFRNWIKMSKNKNAFGKERTNLDKLK